MRLSFILFNPVGRLRSGWRLGIFLSLFFLLTVLLATLAKACFETFGASGEDAAMRRTAFIVSSSLFLFAATFIGWVCARGIEELPFRSLGWSLHGGWWQDLLLGFLFGAGTLLLATGIATLGGLTLTFKQTADWTAIANTVLVSAIVFAFGAAGEEALFRGYPLQTLARARFAWAAILVTSVFFSLVHLGNPNVVPYFTFINTILAGIWFAIAYLKTRNLWFPFAMHWAWNWMMGAILGIPVSGIKEITPHSVLLESNAGPVWLTGGNYGLEGGLACTIALVISGAAIWFAPFIKPTAEMLALTAQENPKRAPSNSGASIFKNYDA